MKKRIIAILLCVLLLSGSVFAASGGSSGDPLVTLSYLTEKFVPSVLESFSTIRDKAVRNAKKKAEKEHTTPAEKSLTLRAGESLCLGTGQYFVMSSGTAKLSVMRGAAVNATQGRETTGGDVRIGNRYIACENAEVYLDATTDAAVTVSYGAVLGVGSPFSDVRRGAWYFSDVANAYARGLVNGMTATTYAPSGTLTFAQCIKLAACMHQLYHDERVTLANSGEGAWYRSYVDYALENGILDAELADYGALIDRRSFVQIFYRALPEKAYKERNAVADDAVPDVSSGDVGAAEIYAFYRAGILSGYSNTPGYADHAFGPDSTINRAEVAAIMNRMFDSAARLSFTMN